MWKRVAMASAPSPIFKIVFVGFFDFDIRRFEYFFIMQEEAEFAQALLPHHGLMAKKSKSLLRPGVKRRRLRSGRFLPLLKFFES